MNLEQQVSNKELSLRLRELGVKQESLAYWYRWLNKGDWKVDLADRLGLVRHLAEGNIISAFTVAELGEMLKSVVKNRDDFRIDLPYWYDTYGKPTWQWHESRSRDAYSECAETEADARASQLIYLIENKLVTV